MKSSIVFIEKHHWLLLLFFISMLDFHVSAQAEGTGSVLGSKRLIPNNHTGI